MKPCWCRFFLAVLVVVFAIVKISFAKIALIVLGVILALMALWGKCCCNTSCEAKKEES